MLLIKLLKHVNYNFLYSTMQESFVTGLKLKNSLTNQEVPLDLSRKTLYPLMGKMSAGIHAGPPYTPTATWVMPGSSLFSQKLLVQWYGPQSPGGVFRIQRAGTYSSMQYCMNITDVDDKIINNSNAEGVEYFEFARRWEADFFDDMKYISHHKANSEFAYLTILPELQSMCLKLWLLSKESLQMAMPILPMDLSTLI